MALAITVATAPRVVTIIVNLPSPVTDKGTPINRREKNKATRAQKIKGEKRNLIEKKGVWQAFDVDCGAVW